MCRMGKQQQETRALTRAQLTHAPPIRELQGMLREGVQPIKSLSLDENGHLIVRLWAGNGYIITSGFVGELA